MTLFTRVLVPTKLPFWVFSSTIETDTKSDDFYPSYEYVLGKREVCPSFRVGGIGIEFLRFYSNHEAIQSRISHIL